MPPLTALPRYRSRALTTFVTTLAAALLTPTTATGFGSNGFLWDAAPRNYVHTDGKVWERSLDGGLRYSLEGGSYEAYRDKFTWIGPTPSVPAFQQAITNAFDTWTTTDPATGLGTGLYFVEDLGTPVQFQSNCCWLNPLGAEIDLVSSVQTDSNAVVPTNLALPITNYDVPDNLKLTSGRTDVSHKPFLGVDIHMGSWGALPYTISLFENILRHEIGHALGLGDVEYSHFIDDNYDGTNSTTALATLTNPWANNINPLNPADPTRLTNYGYLDADPGLLSPGVDILMESRGYGGRNDLSNDDYAARQFHYPKLHFLNNLVVDGFGFEPEGDFTNEGGLTINNNGSMNIPTSTLTLNFGSNLSIETAANASNNHAYINGIATVKDPSSTWTNAGILFIGNGANGVVNVNNNATLTSAGARIGETTGSTGSTGSATVDNATWNTTNPAVELYIGAAGTGILSIQTAGLLNAQGHTRIGVATTGHGIATVNGPGATWNNTGILFVGDQGTANLDIINGGAVTSFGARVGENATASATVNVTNGTWTNSNILVVGNAGTGNLNINAGGTVSSTFGGIAEAGGKGTVTVNPGGQWNTNTLRLGNSGTGTLNIQGGTVNTIADTTIGPGGTINLTAGTLTTPAINNTAGGTFNWTAGHLNLTGPAGLTLGFSPGDMFALNITAPKTLSVTNTTTIDVAATLSISGGALTTRSLNHTGGGGLNHTAGSLAINGGSFLIASTDYHINGPGSPTLAFDAATFNVPNTLYIGNDASGNLTLQNGATVRNTHGRIGESPLANGSVNVASNSFWINSNSLIVGNAAAGSLTINDTGAVAVGPAGTTIGPAGTINLNNGTLTTPSLTNTTGGNLNHTGGTLTINGGSYTPPPGPYTISGPGTPTLTLDDATLTNNHDLTIGHAHDGILNLQNNATLTTSGAARIGSLNTSTASQVTVDAATWTNNGTIIIGHQGTGALTIQNTATVTSPNTAIAHDPGSAGNVTVDNATWTSTDSLAIGFAGPGTLTIRNGATVTNQSAYIGVLPTSTGSSATVESGTWNTLNDLTIGPAATLNLQGGTLTAQTITNNTGGTFNFTNGTLTTDTFNGHLTQNGGTLAPGHSPGTTTINGNYNLTAGTIQIEVQSAATPTPGVDHDQVNITNNVTLAGTLDILPLPDPTTVTATPLGTQYDILTYTTRTPNSFFTTITGTLLSTDFALAPLLNDSTNTLQLRATIPGDLNLDNKVSIADLSTFALNFGTTPGLYNDTDSINSWQLGDFNTDGAITVADLSLLALNFGFDATDPTSTPTPLSLTDAATLAGIDPTTIPAVPEPTTAASLLTALIAPYLRHRKNR